jgi:hypothetical protein
MQSHLPGARSLRVPNDAALRHRGHGGDRILDLPLFRGSLFRLSYMTVMLMESNHLPGP